MLARVAHCVAQPVDAVALHEPHRAGVVIGPDRLRAVPLGRAGQLFGDLAESLVPGDRHECGNADALFTDPPQRMGQALGMMLALGISGDLGADDASCVSLCRSTAHPPDPPAVDALDFERAGARAIVRTNAGDDVERQSQAPAVQSGTDYHNSL